ncbi:MAG TPA: cell division protein ZapA [Prolixibacteraceae bacterium]|nr:cell division protein ZapA [Prolixibacteraceae bacterium]
MKDKLSINIKIDNRSYPLIINREDEERYRNAAKMLNEVVFTFRRDFPDKDPQDILAMAAFQFVYNTLQMKEKADISPVINDLKNLRDDIADFLHEKAVKRS